MAVEYDGKGLTPKEFAMGIDKMFQDPNVDAVSFSVYGDYIVLDYGAAVETRCPSLGTDFFGPSDVFDPNPRTKDRKFCSIFVYRKNLNDAPEVEDAANA